MKISALNVLSLVKELLASEDKMSKFKEIISDIKELVKDIKDVISLAK